MTYDYLASTNEYYSTVQLASPQYSEPYPNPEEAERFGAIGLYLSMVRFEIKPRERVPRILDLGCGRGWLTNLMSPFGECLGIEPSSGAVALATSLFPHLNFTAGTLNELLDSPSFSPFDVVVSSEVIEHVPDNYKSSFIGDIRRSLAPDGYCIITTPRGELYRKWHKNNGWHQPIEEWLTENELRSAFEEAGFVPLHHTRVHKIPFLVSSRVNQNTRFGRVMDAFGLRFLPSAFDYVSSFYQVWLFKIR
ncbi:MAG: class I SAM-dependent methyltransferase [Anaerolineae bacterium]|nr:class I SAM-dependent methyltransferase [Anaerolineae bacterium]